MQLNVEYRMPVKYAMDLCNVRGMRIELITYGLEGHCSIRLSYPRVKPNDTVLRLKANLNMQLE